MFHTYIRYLIDIRYLKYIRYFKYIRYIRYNKFRPITVCAIIQFVWSCTLRFMLQGDSD